MNKQPSHYEFGPYRVAVNDRLLLRDGEIVPLTPKALELLLVLVENSGRVLNKEELMRRVWADSFVEEANLSRNIFTLRKALGGNSNGNQYIETIPKRGYRFVAPVRELRDEAVDSALISQHLAGVVQSQRALAADAERKSRARWYKGLTFVIIALLVAGLALAIYFYAAPRAPKPSASAAIKSIAVLPFRLMGEGHSDEYLSIGMADALITRLSNTGRISVRPTAAVRKYAVSEQDPLAAGQELGVELVLEGNLQKIGDRIRVTVQLINVGDGLSLWADKFDEGFTNVFEVQDSISEKIVESLALKLTRDEQERLVKRYTENIQAYDSYLQGRSHLLRLTMEDTQKAIEAFERAISFDPDYALAYAGLARASAQMRIRFVPEAEIKYWAERAEREAQHALELDPNLAEAHEALAAIYRYTEFDWERAIEESRLALKLNPNLDMPHIYIAGALYHLGLVEMVDEQTRQAMEINPMNRVEPLRNQAVAAFLSGRFEKAIRLLEEMQRLSDTPLPDTWLAQSYFYKGERAKAETMLAELRGSAQVEQRSQATLASFLAARGNRVEAEALLREVIASGYMDHHVAYSIGATYAQLRNSARAIQWLERAVDTGFPCYPWFETDPLLQPIRGNVEFQHFMETLRKSWEATRTRYAN